MLKQTLYICYHHPTGTVKDNLTFTTTILITAPALKNCLIRNLAVSTKLKFLPLVTQTVSIIICCCFCNSPGPQCKLHKILLPLMLDSFKGAVQMMWVTKFRFFWFVFFFFRNTHIQWYMQQVPDIKKLDISGLPNLTLI